VTAVKVVDASAVAAVLFHEPGFEQVVKRLSKCRLAAPSLLPYELANVTARRCRQYPEQSADIFLSLKLLAGLEIGLTAVPAVEGAMLAEREGLSAYDASYLWLARNLNAELVTLDQKLAKKA
jgi:predicted nucleic acid-binding protein